MANPTTTPIMPSSRGPNVPDAQPVYLVDVYGNPITGPLSGNYIFKPVKNVAVTAGTPVSIWTPAATSKRFRLLGGWLTPSVNTNVLLEDATGGANEFLRVPQQLSANASFTPFTLGTNGYLSIAPGNQLFMDMGASGNVLGYIYGTEE